MAQKFRDSTGKRVVFPVTVLRPQFSAESAYLDYRGQTLDIRPSDRPYRVRKATVENGLCIQRPTGKVVTPARKPAMVTIIPSSPAEERAARPKISAAERDLRADDWRWQRDEKHLLTANPPDADAMVELSDEEASRRRRDRITCSDLWHWQREIRRRVAVDRRTGWRGHTYGEGSMAPYSVRVAESRVEVGGDPLPVMPPPEPLGEQAGPENVMGPIKRGHDVLVEIWKDRHPARKHASEAEIKRWAYQEMKIDLRERTAHAVHDLTRRGSISFRLPETDRDHGRGWAPPRGVHRRTLTDRQAFAAMLIYTEQVNPAEDGWRRALTMAQRQATQATRARVVEPTAVIRTRPKRSDLWRVIGWLRAAKQGVVPRDWLVDEKGRPSKHHFVESYRKALAEGKEIGIFEDGRAMLAGMVLGETRGRLPEQRVAQQYMRRETALGLADHLEDCLATGRDLSRGWIEALEVGVGTIDGKRILNRRSEFQGTEGRFWVSREEPPPPLRPLSPSRAGTEARELSRAQVARLAAMWALRQEYGGAIVSRERRARLRGKRKPSYVS